MHGLAVLVPAHVEATLVAAAPIQRWLMGRVSRARREVPEEGPVGSDGLLGLDPCDGIVGEIAGELVPVFGTCGWFDRCGVSDQRGIELVRLAGDEAVEIVETLVGRPIVERPRRAGLVVGDIVVLAPPGAGIAGLFEQLTHGGAALGNDAAIARVTRGHLLDDTGGHRVMIASGQEGSPGWRAERCGVELVVEQATFVEPFRGRHADQTAVDARPSEADVVEQDQEDVGRASRGLAHGWEIRRRILRVEVDGGIGERPLRLGQVIAIEMQREFGTAVVSHEIDGVTGPADAPAMCVKDRALLDNCTQLYARV